MKDKYDVGIYGWWGHENFGGCLTYFALEKIIEKLGYSVLMIQEANGEFPRYTIPQSGIAMSFANKFYNCSTQLYMESMQYFNDICGTFVVGGDQMWNHLIPFVKEDNFLSFVDDDKLKISYSTSFGNKKHNPSREHISKMKPLLKKFDNISVREDFGIRIAKELYDVEAVQVIDAVFLLEKEEYFSVIEYADVELPENYLLAFILNPTVEKRNQIKQIAELLNLEVLCVPDAASATHRSFYNIFNDFTILSPLSVENFLKAYSKAAYVVTDSFHGTCMCYIFKKNFSVYYNETRGADRFYSLMNILKMDNRRIYEGVEFEEEVINNILHDIIWNEADNNIEKEVTKAMEWLSTALSAQKKQHINYKIDEKECTGCGSCISACPVDAIRIVSDKYGFYRAKVDNIKCINCGKCIKVCPVLYHNRSDNLLNPACYAIVAKDSNLVEKSSSGGIFSLLAKDVLNNNGSVCGAKFNENFSVSHVIINSENDLNELRKSKYLQSYQGNIFKEIKMLLDKNEHVLYVGTPCHVMGLKNFLNKDYNKLILVDLLCSNAPSVLFFQKYLLEQSREDIDQYSFRVEPNNCSSVTLKYKNGKVENRKRIIDDDYQRGFHNHIMCPHHCETCKYQNVPRCGDISIGDFWGISNYDKLENYSQGVSLVLCNNEKGKKIINRLNDNLCATKKEVPISWVGGNGLIHSGSKNFVSKGRNRFFEEITKKSFSESLNLALKPVQVKSCFESSNTPLQYSNDFTRFKFEHEYWEEHFINGQIRLIVKLIKTPPGHYACLSLCKFLAKEKEYILDIKFKINTLSKYISFHIKDSGSHFIQVIHKELICNNTGNDWNIVKIKFKADANIYDEFMIGASQISGENNFILFDYIVIRENCNY